MSLAILPGMIAVVLAAARDLADTAIAGVMLGVVLMLTAGRRTWR